MTGFGAASLEADVGTIEVSLRAVNSRFFDLRSKLSAHGPSLEGKAESALKRRLERGRVELRVDIVRGPEDALGLDAESLRASAEAIGALRDELAPGEAFPWALLAKVAGAPGLDSRPVTLPDDQLLAVIDEAATALDAMRRREGDALAAILSADLDALAAELRKVEARVPEIHAAHQVRLTERVAALLDGKAEVDEARIAHEVAIIADKSDVAEEVTRLHAHLGHFRERMGDDGAVGRKLDFLLQEMGREVNTIGSKLQDPALSRRVIEMKSALERLREQVQNVL